MSFETGTSKPTTYQNISSFNEKPNTSFDARVAQYLKHTTHQNM